MTTRRSKVTIGELRAVVAPALGVKQGDISDVIIIADAGQGVAINTTLTTGPDGAVDELRLIRVLSVVIEQLAHVKQGCCNGN